MSIKVTSDQDLNERPKAIIYCENHFGGIDGKTANGLVRHSEKYEIVSVIDSQKAGQDAGMVLDNTSNNIAIYRDLDHALQHINELPEYLIYGIAPVSGILSQRERHIMLKAMSFGMNIVNGLHEFLNDDPEFIAAAKKYNVTLIDVRQPRSRQDLTLFSGQIKEVTCPRIAILGTDCAIGKRTTATILTKILQDAGLHAVMIGTGQTGLIQGARYGVALDSIPSNFCAGEVEAEILKAFRQENPDVIIIEGQSALSHPAFSSSVFILRGGCPEAVILQHAPKREHRCDFEDMPMPTPESEINLIEIFSDTKVIGMTLNHENMSKDDIETYIAHYEKSLDIPVTDALTSSPDRLVDMVVSAFPLLKDKLSASL